MLILAILAFGMIVGWLAQLVLGMGTRPNAQSLIAGLVGSFVGGLLASLLAGDGLELQPSGLIGSFVGAVIVLLIWRAIDALGEVLIRDVLIRPARGRRPPGALGSLVLAAVAVLGACGGSDRTDPPTTAPSTTAPESAPATAPPTTAASAAGLLAAACDGELTVRDAGVLPADLTSVSGLAASRRSDDVVWAVEDSLEPADVVALRTDGSELGRVRVQGGPLTNLDWEDLAIWPGPDGVPEVWVADIGDNLSIRPSVQLYVFDEPSPDAGSIEPRVIRATYQGPDGARVRPNAEALVVSDDGVWVLDKAPDGPATLYHLELSPEDPDSGTFVAVSTVDLPGEQVTALDLSPDGTVLAVRTTDAVRLYSVPDGADVATALAGTPCAAPSPPEGQGESMAVLPGSQGLLTVSESERGDPVTLHRITPE